jgi:hypothetical protein
VNENGQAEPLLVAERVCKVHRPGGIQRNRHRAEATLRVRHARPRWAYA